MYLVSKRKKIKFFLNRSNIPVHFKKEQPKTITAIELMQSPGPVNVHLHIDECSPFN
jgi:hypothetical protein